MKIALIGMSTVGKSYWSQKLVDAGFERLDLDNIIASYLAEYTGMPQPLESMSDWLGLPNEAHFVEKERILMQFEENALKYALSVLEKKETTARIIIDTGGSLVYTPPQYWAALKQFTQIVYLQMDKTLHPILIENYLREPRAMLWNGTFDPKIGESLLQTYTRCYTNLVEGREKLYAQYAHCTIPYATHRNKSLTTIAFLNLLGNQ